MGVNGLHKLIAERIDGYANNSLFDSIFRRMITIFLQIDHAFMIDDNAFVLKV